MIYVHLQKCGGTSIEQAFADHCKWNDILIGSSTLGELMQWEYFGKYGLHKHSTAKEIQKAIGESDWHSYYSWCTVRNPYQRVTSLYGYLSSLVARHAEEAKFPRDASPRIQHEWAESNLCPATEPWTYPAVRAFLRSRSAPEPYSSFLRDANLTEDAAFQPQWWGVQGLDGESLAVNQIVRLEDISSAWPEICDRFGFDRIHLAKVNATSSEHQVDPRVFFADSADIELVTQRFCDDFVRFGYNPGQV